MNFYKLMNTKEGILMLFKFLLTKELMVAIDFYSMKKKWYNYESMRKRQDTWNWDAYEYSRTSVGNLYLQLVNRCNEKMTSAACCFWSSVLWEDQSNNLMTTRINCPPKLPHTLIIAWSVNRFEMRAQEQHPSSKTISRSSSRSSNIHSLLPVLTHLFRSPSKVINPLIHSFMKRLVTKDTPHPLP